MISIVKEVPRCDTCQEWSGCIDSGINHQWAHYCLRCWLTAIKARFSDRKERVPLLGKGVGQLWVTSEDLAHEGLKEQEVKCNVEKFGDTSRYTITIHHNRFVSSEDRSYCKISPPKLISGVVDIACRIYPFETHITANTVKVWLQRSA